MAQIQKSFIETQFPVSKVSKESYKERKAGASQTLTGLGKWWGRKPLIMVRATILGLLLPATDNPKKDHEIFLRILGMDDAGLLARKYKAIPLAALHIKATATEKVRYFIESDKPVWRPGIDSTDKASLQRAVFLRMGYDEKITYCKRPEEMENIPDASWPAINSHLGTTAQTLQELMEQLSIQRYGEIITVGDCFAGGGSIPFEAARMGLKAYGSDLNPVAALLTWASLNINGASDTEVKKLRDFQETVYNAVDKQITAWGIEHNEQGDRAIAYLYCNETKCPACGWQVPLSPSWVIGRGTKTVATLQADEVHKRFDIGVASGVSADALKAADAAGTVGPGGMTCPHCHTTTPIASIRRDRRVNGQAVSGLRHWEKTDFMPETNDVFQETLYCIKYERTHSGRGERYYTAPTEDDRRREEKVIALLSERFAEWQELGYIPSDRIEPGEETSRLLRERGWGYWHQLFNPRQLLLGSLMLKIANLLSNDDPAELTVVLLGLNQSLNFNSRISPWQNDDSHVSQQAFYNQALNTLSNYACRPFSGYKSIFFVKPPKVPTSQRNLVATVDARDLNANCQVWITDPPYADAVNYHELSEFFLAWDKKLIEKTFPEWYSHSNRSHAVKGTGSSFAHAMVDVYKNLSNHMPDDGAQVVMFTHQDPAVWAELSLILWSAGLHVTAAWNIATETESGGLKAGNYVKGTVLMVLRKNLGSQSGWLEDIYPQIKREVKLQIDSMRDLDSGAEPDFTDNDYMLAAYAASLKVLTSYKTLGDVNVELELNRERDRKNKSPIQTIIESAVRVAFEYLIPKGFSKATWKDFTKEEKYYIKALEFERTGNFALSSYQELARGLGVAEYTTILASSKANAARVKTPLELANKYLSDSHPLAKTLVRQILMAIYVSVKNDDAAAGKNWLRNEVPTYWTDRPKISEVFDAIIAFETVENTEHWAEPVQYAKYIKSLVENDGV